MKRDKEKRPQGKAPAGMSVDAILAQLASMKDNAASFLEPEPADPEGDAIWRADVAACEAATAILSVLQDAGIADAEQAKDLIHDYNGLARQYQSLHAKYEKGAKATSVGGVYLCPACSKQMRPGNNHCWNCGHKLKWGVG